MEKESYDLAIIGGGPAGYTAALRAQGEGARVCIVESGSLGGTCLNRGCIPTKCFYHSTKTYHRIRENALPEIVWEKLSLDYAKMLERKNSVVTGLRDGLEALLKKTGVKIIRGKGFINKDKDVEIIEGEGKGRIVSGKMILLATGSSPSNLPFIPQDSRIHNTDSIWDLNKPPKNLLIIGGGVIGIEAATIYSVVAKSVTLIEILPEILVNVGKSYKRVVSKSLDNRGVKILTGKRVTSIKPDKESIMVYWEGDTEAKHFDEVLVAVGRKPNISGVFDEKLGLSTKSGFIEVGKDMQTSCKGIYAAGDIIGNPMLAHAASREAMVAVNRGLGFDPDDFVDFEKIPDLIFSDPEIAKVGFIPEAGAKREEGISIGRFPYITSSKALCEAESEGFAEVVFNEKSGKIIGGGIVGAHASDLIGEMIVMVNAGLDPHIIERSVHPHPTLTEIIWEASADSIGKAIYKMRKK
jgi:dihydrolipoamide dehydrogenase